MPGGGGPPLDEILVSIIRMDAYILRSESEGNVDPLVSCVPLWIASIVGAELTTLLPVLEASGLWWAERVGALGRTVAWLLVI